MAPRKFRNFTFVGSGSQGMSNKAKHIGKNVLNFFQKEVYIRNRDTAESSGRKKTFY